MGGDVLGWDAWVGDSGIKHANAVELSRSGYGRTAALECKRIFPRITASGPACPLGGGARTADTAACGRTVPADGARKANELPVLDPSIGSPSRIAVPVLRAAGDWVVYRGFPGGGHHGFPEAVHEAFSLMDSDQSGLQRRSWIVTSAHPARSPSSATASAR